ncbi:hypothetical protein ACFQHN_26425 [Natrialbaceae archaeon GCM10025896]
MSERPPYPSLWCGQHGEWEPTARACDSAFDPDEVDWLVHDPMAENGGGTDR